MTNAKDDRAKRGQPNVCTWFEQLHGLSGARNDALHGPREHFTRHELSWYEITTDHLILNALEWVVARGATTVSELDSELNAFAKGTQPPPGYPWFEKSLLGESS